MCKYIIFIVLHCIYINDELNMDLQFGSDQPMLMKSVKWIV